MNPAQQRLDRARHELNAAEIDAQAQERAELVKRLQTARRELREAQQEYQHMALEIKAEDNLRNRTQQRISALVLLIGESHERMPNVARWLPEDPDSLTWAAQHHALENDLAEVIAFRDAIPRTDRVRAIQLGEGPTSRIATLTLAVQNLLNRLDGSITKLEGGIYSVS